MIIIVVTIFTFVYWGSQSGRYGDRRGSGNYGSIDGVRISQEEFARARDEVLLRYFINYASWPDSDGKKTDFDPEREIYQWLFFLRKLDQYGIQVDTRSVAETVNDILREFGRGNPIPFDTFVKQLLAPKGITAEDFENYVRHDLAIQQLVSVVTLGGRMVTPQEGRYLFERDHQDYSTEAAFFSGSNYLARVTDATPAAVAQYYTNAMSAYHVPERMQVSYVSFPLSNYMASAAQHLTNLTADVEEGLRRLGTNYLRLGKTPDEARVRIREELLHREALAGAQKSANDFESTLFAMDPAKPGNLAALAKTNGLTVKVTAPFDQDNGPSDFDGGPSFAKEAFALSDDQPFPDRPIEGSDSLYVIAFDKRYPDEILPLDQIRDRVTSDFKYHEAVMMARRAGEDFARAATNGIAHGKTFKAVCSEANVPPVSVPPFSLSTRDLPVVENHVELSHFKQVAAGTPVRQVSEFNSTPSGGFVVYVEGVKPVDAATVTADLPGFMNLLRRARQQEALNLWITKEASVSLRDTPLAQRKQSSSGAGPSPE